MPPLSRFVAVFAFLLLCLPAAEAGRLVVDSAGRKVEVPDKVTRVLAAGPPASVLVYMLASDKLIGWNRRPSPEELPYLSPSVHNLPELGRLTGRGGTANLEVVLAAKPDLIIDFGSIADTYVSLADRVQSQTGIPYILIDGRFANSVAAVRLLGSILGVEERAEKLAQYTEKVLTDIDAAAAAIPADKRPRTYLARGPRGLETGNRGSINTEIIERAGAVNVVDTGSERGGILNVSLEQLLLWNPDTIITLEAGFPDTAKSATGWDQVDAVKRNRIFVSPKLPYGWVDAPPSLNRIIGLQWLGRLLMPERFPGRMRDVAREFYKLFYQVDLSEEQLDRLLAGAGQ